MSIPQPHRCAVWRPTVSQDAAQKIDGYTLVYENVPCFIQPADTKEVWFYMQRGTEVTHNIYTLSVSLTLRRNDIWEIDGNQFHIEADPKNALMRNLYLELPAVQYPEEAKKRLDREAYE
jgi:hypothetical protein